MKRPLLALLTSFVFMAYCLAQDIPNPGFEEWQDYTLFDEPEGYFTTNSQAYFLGTAPNVTRAPGRLPGTSSLRMEVDESVFFGISPIAFILDLSNPLGGGIPFNGRPDSLVGHFNYRLSPEDTFSVIVLFKLQGLPIGFAQIDLTGSSNGFERVSIPTGPFIFPPDSVAIAMGIGVIAGTPALGDFVEVDDLRFIGSNAQLPNNEFENWETISFREPLGWGSTNLFAALGREGEESVSRTTDAYAGSYAARLESIEYEFFGFRDTSGILLTGDINTGREGFPCSSAPERLDFYYKFQPTGAPNELALVNVGVYGQGNELGQFYQILAPSSDYTYAQVFFPPVTGTPDTCVIGFAVGITDTIEERSNPGSVLYVDELAFGPGVRTRELPRQQVTDLIYPNPATEFVRIKTEVLDSPIQRIDIVSLDGRWVRSVGRESAGVFISDLSPGWYTILVVTEGREYLSKFEKY